MDLILDTLEGFGPLFYIVSPNQTSFPTIEHIPKPNYTSKAIPYFITLIILENIILWIKNKPKARINDGIISLSHGMFLICANLIVRGIESYIYIKIYDNFRIYELPWDSPYTWYLTALLVDLGYYWLHRAAHEINILWSLHQVHHSSEDFNLTTAVRQSAFQGWFVWIIYLPMAFFIPPSIYLIHFQFNVLFQFWIHTELIESLGPLEYILNTPKHHRIHHGSNRYCLDKNYAGVFIIWDRIFGTFTETKSNEKIIYGLVEEVNSFNPIWLQIFYFSKIRSKMNEQTNWKDKLSAVFKGPGWAPGKPRLGDINDVPEISNRTKYDVNISIWKNIYILAHFSLLLIAFAILNKYNMALNQWNVIISVSLIIYSLTSIGFILDGRRIGGLTEIIRCIFILFIPSYFEMNYFISIFIYEFYTLSIAIMIYLLAFSDKEIQTTQDIKLLNGFINENNKSLSIVNTKMNEENNS